MVNCPLAKVGYVRGGVVIALVNDVFGKVNLHLAMGGTREVSES